MKRLPSTTTVNNAIQRELTSNFDVVKFVALNMDHIKAANDMIASGAVESAAVVMAIKDQVMNVSSNMQAVLDVAAGGGGGVSCTENYTAGNGGDGSDGIAIIISW